MSKKDFFFQEIKTKKDFIFSLILNFVFRTYLPFDFHICLSIISNHFSRAVRGENFLYVSRGGIVHLIYPNEPSIESLQLMFVPKEKEEIFGKWGFMIR